MSSTAKNDLTFLPHPNVERIKILAPYQSYLDEFTSLIARQPENLVSDVARTFDLASTPDHFARYGKLRLPKAVNQRQKLQGLLDHTLGQIVDMKEYGFVRGRLIEILVESIVENVMGYAEIRCDTMVLVRGVVVAYPLQHKPNQPWVRSLDVCGLSSDWSHGIFLECKARPQLFLEENIRYLKGLGIKLATIRQSDYRVFGITLMLKDQLKLYYFENLERQQLIRSIHDLHKL